MEPPKEKSEERENKRLIIVSNRLPILCHKVSPRNWHIEPSSGGLVTALDPVFKNRGGIWIGWPGTTNAKLTELKKPLQKAAQGYGYRFIPVSLTEKEKDGFYLGFSNEVLWPLFHDLQTHCNFDPSYFRTYQKVNQKFSRVIAKNTGPKDLIWVQDYHLMGVAEELRKIGVKSRIAFFLHIPFPPMDIFLKLPWREQILKSLLEFDVIGFQTVRDVRNFMESVRILAQIKPSREASSPSKALTIEISERKVAIGSFPISIDFKAFAYQSADPDVHIKSLRLREDLPRRQLIVGVDRLDYTKGIPYKLEAFRNALLRYPELRGKVTLVQNVVPSRESILEYHELKTHIEQLVGEINGQFTRSGWVPIHYLFHHMSREELLAFYNMAKIAMVTPLKDGMNLVAKEYCAANYEEDGVLILSEFAGSAAQLHKGALLVNPYNIEEMADRIFQAYHMDLRERRSRMKRLRRQIRQNDIFKWAESFLNVAISKDLSSFPVQEDYVPHMGIA